MRNFLKSKWWLAVLTLLVATSWLAGCGGGSQEGGAAKTGGYYVAQGINDGANPAVPQQRECPVCGNPITPDVHTESSDSRVYFDREECLNKWKKNKSQYMDNLKKEAPSGPPIPPDKRKGN